ncbi:MAG TPA: acyltransferase family protein [Polyangia bacterium]|jgi:fucose 4-O-acetylase-like acetyltransferase
MRPTSPEGSSRLDWIDAARGIGMILMFYGHVLQRGFPPSNASAADQMRFVYSFHMPFFFVMSGFFFRPTRDLGRRVRQLAARRLVPVVFFALVFLPLWMFGELRAHVPIGHDVRDLIVEYLRGRPHLDWLTWFLVCLFVCEVMAAVVLSRVANPLVQLGLGVALVVAGVLLSNASLTPSAGVAYAVGRTWFLTEAVVALGLYAIGRAAFPWLVRASRQRLLVWLGAVGGLAVVLLTYRHNPGTGVVIMAARDNGDPLCFLGTALAGTLAVLALGVILERVEILRAIGRDTLPLLGLDFFFFEYANPKLARLWHVADSQPAVLGASLAVTILSMLACVPLLRLLNRYVPQLVGKSGVSGPWLPALEPRFAAPARGASLLAP